MCGVIGVYDVERPLEVSFDLMTSLQYRGEQGAGFAFEMDGGPFFHEREVGVLPELKRKIDFKISSGLLDPEKLKAGIGHLRYGTAGFRRSLENVQPLYQKMFWGDVFLAHNGDTPNYDKLQQSLIQRGAVFATNADTEFILKFISLARARDPIEAIRLGLYEYKGTFSLAMLIRDREGTKLIAARDPSGNRPLALGRLGRGFVVASEDSSFELIDAEFMREVRPGEMIIFSEKGLESRELYSSLPCPRLHQCSYELIYFSFPTSSVFGASVSEFRETLGKIAARRWGHLIQPDDIIINVPDSSNAFADGFCEALKQLPKRALVRRHSFDLLRTFTMDTQERRDDGVRKKFGFDRRKVAGKRVWVLDDSIVRGTTARRIVRMLRAGGASWVGFISSAPSIIGDCRKGMDFAENLVAARCEQEYVCKAIEADFLCYPTLDDLKEAFKILGLPENNFCFGCFEGREPIWNVW